MPSPPARLDEDMNQNLMSHVGKGHNAAILILYLTRNLQVRQK